MGLLPFIPISSRTLAIEVQSRKTATAAAAGTEGLNSLKYNQQVARHSKSLVDSAGGSVKFLMNKWELGHREQLVPSNLERFFSDQANYATIYQPNPERKEFFLRKHFIVPGIAAILLNKYISEGSLYKAHVNFWVQKGQIIRTNT